MATNPGQLQTDVDSLTNGRTIARHQYTPQERRVAEHNAALMQEFRRRRGGQRTAGVGHTTGSMGDISTAIPRFYDPMEYWDLSGLPWNMADEGHRHKLHKWMRLYYATHRLVPILVDIFTRFPLVGMHLYSKDKKLTSFYEKTFLDDLKYEDYLVNVGREYWVVGEAWDLISFNENLGTIERCELLNPEDIVIENFPMMGTKQFKVTPPEYLRNLVDTKSPPKEYKQLETNWPELIPYLKKGEAFPVSDVMLKQVAFKITDWDDHGTPILLRGLRTLMHEEKLLASQDAIAERLYSPLILAKLGVQELGPNQGPWIPGPEELEAFRDDLDIALSSDFRVMVHHFALEMENVFGREQVPDLSADFDRVERSLMWVFGINPSMLGGGADSQPYASSALQAEFMNQMLTTYQRFLKELYRSRALLIAEAQEHYDFERKGQTRVPVFEEVVLTDEETGKMRIEKMPKLLIPDLEFETMDLRDEATERQFLQTLRSMGLPISDSRLMVGIKSEWWEDSLDEMQTEMVQKTIAQQHAKLMAYKILMTQGLPIPPDLKAEVESIGTETGPGGGAGAPGPAGGMMPPGPAGMGGPPPGGGMVMPPPPPGLGPGPGTAPPGGGAPPAGPGGAGAPSPGGNVPAVSNERRPGLTYNTHMMEKVNKLLADLEHQKRLGKTASVPADNTDELEYVASGVHLGSLNDEHPGYYIRRLHLAPHIRKNLEAQEKHASGEPESA